MKKVLRMFLWIIVILIALAVIGAVYVRNANDDPLIWHLDPEGAKGTGKPNDFRVSPTGEGKTHQSPVFDMSPAALMTKFQKMALAQPDTILLGERDGFATYVQRTKLVQYPDYISVKAVKVDGGSALHIYSRSRFGYSDGGMNRKRILSWLKKL